MSSDGTGETQGGHLADPLYVAARGVLLDALFALAAHREAVIVAGAQAVYLQIGSGEIAVAPYTSDADLTIDPRALAESPQLEAAMSSADFHLKIDEDGHAQPGVWLASASVGGEDVCIPVDLIVPEGVTFQHGRRAARLPGHGERAARRTTGLEAALVDHQAMTIAALDPADGRSTSAKVAGVAALLVSKAHKLNDRVADGRRHRLDDKDAADVVRIMQATSIREVATTFASLVRNPVAADASAAALTYLERLFGRRGRPGIEMAGRALRTGMPKERIETLCTAYVAGLMQK
jgi:hypothetical protein